MENYLKSSNDTRDLEQKVYELDIQRYKLIVKGYKDKLDEKDKIHSQEVESLNLRANEEIKALEEKHEEFIKKVQKEMQEKEIQFIERERKLKEEFEKIKIENKSKKEDTNKKDQKEIKSLKEEIKDLKKQISIGEFEQSKDLKSEIKDLSNQLEEYQKKEIPNLQREIKDLTKKLEKKTSNDSDKLILENKNLQEKFEDVNNRNKSLERELNEFKKLIKKKEEGWLKAVLDQNDIVMKTLSMDSCKLSSILEGINNLKNTLTNQKVHQIDFIIEELKNECKNLIGETLKSQSNIKDKTISTLKASNDTKNKIIKKQAEKISKKKPEPAKIEESSDEIVIKPEEEDASIVFGIEKSSKGKAKEKKEDQLRKKLKTNSFDEAVLKSSKNKKPLPVVKKAFLPKEAQKLNNNSFFANITFTDSSPVIKKDADKRK